MAVGMRMFLTAFTLSGRNARPGSRPMPPVSHQIKMIADPMFVMVSLGSLPMGIIMNNTMIVAV